MFTDPLRLCCRSLTALLCLAPTARSFAQPASQTTAAVDVLEAYDSNLLFAPHGRIGDFQTRISPSLESQRQWPLADVIARYALDADRFANYPSLSAVTGQRAGVNLTYRPAARLAVTADAAFIETHTPGELNVESGLGAGRAEARRLLTHSRLTRELNANQAASLEYSLVDDYLASAGRMRAHHAAVGLDRHPSPRSTTMFRYELSLFAFAPNMQVTTQVLTAGWTRNLTRATSISASGGPVLSETGVTPQLAAAIQSTLQSVRLAVEFTRTQATLVGVSGLTDTSTLAAPFRWMPSRRTNVTITPAVARVVYRSAADVVCHVSLEVSRTLSQRTSLVANYEANLQQVHSELGGALQRDKIARHVVSIGIRRAPSARQEAR